MNRRERRMNARGRNRPEEPPLKLWDQACWERFGPRSDPRINGIILTVMVTQRTLAKVYRDYGPRPGERLPVAAILDADGPGCCLLGEEEMGVLSYASRSDVLDRIEPGRLDEGDALETYLERVREDMKRETGGDGA